MKSPTTTTSAPHRPRNPFVALARQRRSGRHGPSGKAQRQRDRQALCHHLAARSVWESEPC